MQERGVHPKQREGSRAATYARVSDQTQAGEDKTSLSEQVADMESYCRDRGYTITARYQDVGHGWSKKRAGFQRMLADAKEGRFDVIVCWKSDRLSRGMFPAAALMEVVDAYQIGLEAVKDAIDPNVFAMMAIVSKWELDSFRERTIMGRRGMAKRGRIPGNRVPYGYRKGEGGNPEVEEDEAEVVSRIFHQCIHEGISAKSIAGQLNAEGIPTKTPGARWHGATVSRILRNATYKGTWQYGKFRHILTDDGRIVHQQPESTWIAIDFPQLVDDESWAKAQDAINLHISLSERNTQLVYTLQHFVTCAGCGSLFGGRAKRSTTVTRNHIVYRYTVDPPLRYYYCPKKANAPPECRLHPYIEAGGLEDLVWDEVVQVVLSPEFIRRGIESVRKPENGRLRERLAKAERELQALKAQESRVVTMCVEGKLSEAELDEQRKSIAAKRERLSNTRDECLDQVTVAEAAYDVSRCTEEVRKSLEGLGAEGRKQVMLLLLDHLTVDCENGVRITMAVPADD